MKKKSITITILLTGVFILSALFIILAVCMSEQLSQPTVSAELCENTGWKYRNVEVPMFFTLTEGEVGEYLPNSLYYMYEKLPTKITDTFFENGWQVILTTKNIEETYWDGEYIGKIAGITVYGDKRIYIQAKQSSIESVTIHEFGHYLDYISNRVSKTPEFMACYEEEQDTEALSDYAKTNSMEFFAEAFELYILDEELARKEIPNTVVIIEETLEI